jgi:hypothetical protein
MTGHHKWSDIRNALMDEPLHRHLREELRRVNDLALELGRLRDQRAAVTTPATVDDGTDGANQLVIHETEYLAALRDSIEELGGRLTIAAVFPDQCITLSPISCTNDESAIEKP